MWHIFDHVSTLPEILSRAWINKIQFAALLGLPIKPQSKGFILNLILCLDTPAEESLGRIRISQSRPAQAPTTPKPERRRGRTHLEEEILTSRVEEAEYRLGSTREDEEDTLSPRFHWRPWIHHGDVPGPQISTQPTPRPPQAELLSHSQERGEEEHHHHHHHHHHARLVGREHLEDKQEHLHSSLPLNPNGHNSPHHKRHDRI